MNKPTKILVTGACGQIGTELVAALIRDYGRDAIIPTDIIAPDNSFTPLNVLDGDALEKLVQEQRVTQIYHLAAFLSARAEQSPLLAWDLNMRGLLNVLEASRKLGVERIFWPSSIAVFGPASPRAACFQSGTPDPLTVYGISKNAGEYWCRWYRMNHGLDVRSIRYPGLISYTAPAGGGTTDYAVDIFHKALTDGHYTCFLRENTALPMLYMPDAIRGTLQLMNVAREELTVKTSYNLAGLHFTPAELAKAIKKHVPGFTISYEPDYRQQIADSWPSGILDLEARHDWGWAPEYDLPGMVNDMLDNLNVLLMQQQSRLQLLNPALAGVRSVK